MSTKTIPQGDIASGINESGNPIKIGGTARQTNPTAVPNATRVAASYDDLGRQLMRPFQVRDLISTGSAVLTRVSETTVLSAVAATFLDLIMVTGANTTGVAVQVDLRSGTGNGIADSLVIPASSSATKSFTIPYPATVTAQPWTAQWSGSTGEISDSPITITMLASQEI